MKLRTANPVFSAGGIGRNNRRLSAKTLAHSTRTWAAAAATVTALVLGVCAQSVQAAFPDKPVTLIAHTAAGSSTDIFARELAHAAEPILGQPVVVVNRPGGGGATQMALIKKAAPDGYTVGVNTITHLTSMETTLKGIYSWKDFSWIALCQFDPYIWVVAANSPYKTLHDLAERAKKSSGKELNVGGYGSVGSAHNIAFNLLADAAGFKFNWVAYPGGAQAMTALLGGHIDAVNTNAGPALQFVKAKRVRVLGVLDDHRLQSFPDVPTASEAGYKVDTNWKQIRGIYGPKGIPEDIQKKLAHAFHEAMKNPAFVKYMKTSGQIAGNLGPQEYTSFIEKEDVLVRKSLKKLGIEK